MNSAHVVAEAGAAAERAAHGAGVSVRELHEPEEILAACRLLDRVWQPDPGNPLITPELMRVFAHSGSYVVGVHLDGRMTGVCLGFLASTGLHSHIAGVDGDARGRNIGYTVKLHQRAWALERGITTVTWTFDPLISRNAYFNLAKLGAVPSEYLTDFYGTMHDAVNAGTETDRLLVRWELTGEAAVRAAAGTPGLVTADSPGARTVVGLDAKPDGRPAVGRRDGDTVLVHVPAQMEKLRRTDPDVAREWRYALREVLGGLMEQGHAVTGFTRDGWYVIDKRQETRE
ncbi:GNAT family N-acetyltransferase [Streptomyces sp. BE147]|uniref:GNAT family N-acetyltransferase n=1 Tax=Streptomyces sp. BE147 TaxID=3002524 RepID=UPI002E798158|nr:GNAT family N-acetyltransferase [Streptomyces sp. BE147]MEE1742487.1 GNAT family N-acetyltransferase [Streptomyces sp. BE147]